MPVLADTNHINVAIDFLKKGDVIIYPTDTLYGFGADATRDDAIIMLNEHKQRLDPISILLSTVAEIPEFSLISDMLLEEIEGLLPGPYTVLLEKRASQLSSLITQDSNLIGIRIPEHFFCREMVHELGKPITSTSVNRHGQAPQRSLSDFESSYPHVPVFYDKDPVISSGSTIIDFSQTPPVVIRQGDGKYPL